MNSILWKSEDAGKSPLFSQLAIGRASSVRDLRDAELHRSKDDLT